MKRNYIVVFSFALLFLAACSENSSSVDSSDEISSSLSSSSSKQKKSSSSSKKSNSSVKSSSSVKSLSNEPVKKVDDGCIFDSLSNTVKDLRDGQVYKTVNIGGQVWMAENLNYKTVESFCFNNIDNNCSKFGRLYTWATAIDSAGVFGENGMGCGFNQKCSPIYPVRGICFKGWHIPDAQEWNKLVAVVGDPIGSKLKSVIGWNDRSGNGMDLFGFSVLPSGFRDFVGAFYGDSTRALFWSATEHDWYKALSVEVQGYGGSDAKLSCEKDFAISIRCVKD